MICYKELENKTINDDKYSYSIRKFKINEYTLKLMLYKGRIMSIGCIIDRNLKRKGYCEVFFSCEWYNNNDNAIFTGEIKTNSYYFPLNSIDDAIAKMRLAKDVLKTMIYIIKKVDSKCIIK